MCVWGGGGVCPLGRIGPQYPLLPSTHLDIETIWKELSAAGWIFNYQTYEIFCVLFVKVCVIAFDIFCVLFVKVCVIA